MFPCRIKPRQGKHVKNRPPISAISAISLFGRFSGAASLTGARCLPSKLSYPITGDQCVEVFLCRSPRFLIIVRFALALLIAGVVDKKGFQFAFARGWEGLFAGCRICI